jgi:hypothetical protein
MPFLRIWFATRFQRHHPIENIRSRQLVSYPCILLSMVKPTAHLLKYKIGNDGAEIMPTLNLRTGMLWERDCGIYGTVEQ